MSIHWKKILPYFISISALGSGSAIAWEAGWIELLIQQIWQVPFTSSKEEKTLVVADSLFLLPPPQDTFNPLVDDLITWIEKEEEEEELRSSKMKKAPTKPPLGDRIGCICMDNDRQLKTGTGACSGHGGVRFWLYQQKDGFVLEFPTKRHQNHPAPLSAEEQSQLAAHKSKNNAQQATNTHQFTFLDLLMLFIICLTIAYIAKLWWDKPIS